MAKKPHRAGSYHVQSRKVRDAAKANPATRCARCGLTIFEVRARYPRRRVRWVAGHVIPGQPNGELRPECSVCSGREGQAMTTARRYRHRTELTW